jgi:PhnB protein
MAQRLTEVMTSEAGAVPASPPPFDAVRSSSGRGAEDVVLTQVVLTQKARGRGVVTGRGFRPGGLPEALEAELAPFHSVTPRVVVGDVTAVEFLRAVFDVAGEFHVDRPAEIQFGDSLAGGQRELFPTFLYVYVDDADRAFRRALAAGAVSLEDPVDAPYGDRRATVRDPFGNVFQIAHRRM